MSHFVVIGLGSNLGDREGYLRRAITLLTPHLSDVKESCVYASPAMLPKDASKEWDMPYLNMVVSGRTALSADELLSVIMQIEHELGRSRAGHWGPREIDLDILAVDQLLRDDDVLHIPHPGILERAFVWMPMKDVAPHWVYPRPSPHQGKTMDDIAMSLLEHKQNCQLYKTQLP